MEAGAVEYALEGATREQTEQNAGEKAERKAEERRARKLAKKQAQRQQLQAELAEWEERTQAKKQAIKQAKELARQQQIQVERKASKLAQQQQRQAKEAKAKARKEAKKLAQQQQRKEEEAKRKARKEAEKQARRQQREAESIEKETRKLVSKVAKEQAKGRASMDLHETESADRKARKEAENLAWQQQFQIELSESEARKEAKQQAQWQQLDSAESKAGVQAKEQAEKEEARRQQLHAESEERKARMQASFEAMMKEREEREAGKQAKREEKKARKQADIRARREERTARRPQLLRDAPITELMLRDFVSPTQPAYHDIIIDNILRSIGERIVAQRFSVLTDSAAATAVAGSEPCETLILRGRTPDLCRIDFAPTATGVSSIASKLQSALQKQDWTADVEQLLCLFVAWNRSAFSEIDPEQMVVQVLPGDQEKRYRSCWFYHQKAYKALTPVTWYKRKETVATVVRSVRKRCQLVDPGSPLLRDVAGSIASSEADDMVVKEMEQSAQREWSLVKDTEGFGAKVMSCFSGLEATSEEYEERIERCFYAFKVANKTAVYGLPDKGEV